MASSPGQRRSTVFDKGVDNVISDVDRLMQNITFQITSGQIPFDQRMEFLASQEQAIKNAYQTGMNDLYLGSMRGSYGAGIDQALDELEANSIPGTFDQDDLQNFADIRRTNTSLYTSDSTRDSDVLFGSLRNWGLTQTLTSTNPFDFNYKSLKNVKHGSTVVDTQVNAFFRTTNFVAATNAGVKRFRYVGPSPERPFCDRIIGKVFTVDQINNLDNGQTSNVFATGGGFNCRHRWVAIAPTVAERRTDEAVAVSG